MNDVISTRQRLRLWATTAFLGTGAALFVFRHLTMRTLFVETDRPLYGFPFPAYGWSQVSTGAQRLHLVPLALDLGVLLLVLAPATYFMLRKIGPPWPAWLAPAAFCVPISQLFWPMIHAIFFGAQVNVGFETWPTECRSLWIGKLDPMVDYTDKGDVCAMARLTNP